MSLHDEFEKLKSGAVATKSEKYAFWTDASVFPDADWEAGSGPDALTLCRDWQSFGQQIINYAASKTMQQLFPIGKAFFKIDMSRNSLQEVARTLQIDPGRIPGELVQAANIACRRLHWRGNYGRLSWAFKALYVTGNVLLFKRNDGSVIAYTTRNYAIRRDGTGQPLRLVLKERLSYRMLPAAVKAGFSGIREDSEDLQNVYTGVEWQPMGADGKQMVRIWQEAGSWKSQNMDIEADLCPFLPLAFDLVPGESYGRGAVEANAGDFARYSELARALALYEIESCKVVKAVTPGSVSDFDALADAESGEYVQADASAVSAVEFGDAKKIAELRNELQAIEARLSRTFGYGGNMRDAERVTAYEVALSAEEADTVQGGLYSRLSHSLSYPLALLFLQETDPAVLQLVLSAKASVGIVTGIPALGQSSEVRSLLQAAQEASVIVQALGGISQRFSPDKIADLTLIASQFDPEQIERDEDELGALQQSSAPIDPTDPSNLVQAIQGVQSA